MSLVDRDFLPIDRDLIAYWRVLSSKFSAEVRVTEGRVLVEEPHVSCDEGVLHGDLRELLDYVQRSVQVVSELFAVLTPPDPGPSRRSGLEVKTLFHNGVATTTQPVLSAHMITR